MQKLFVLLFCAVITVGCSGGGGPSGPDTATDPCSNAGQKQFVLDAMNDWYLWNDLLPANVNLDNFATPQAVLDHLTSFQPLDNFSFLTTAEADQQLFGEGKFEGYGFSSRFVASGDLRLTRVFADGPAGAAGLARGDRIVTLDGRTIADIESNEGVFNFLASNSTLNFGMRRPDTSEYDVAISQGIVTIDPVPQWRIIDADGGRKVGYMELASFISTADPVFATVFGEFGAANVTEVIIDMRYNGGGLVSTAELLGDYLGGLVAENLTFSRTEFNADRAADNNDQEFFERRINSISLSSVVVIATQRTASASELVANSMIPHVDVQIVGDRTFGKPVGQIGLEFCGQLLRPTSFQTVNANGEGDYFDGLPVGAGCEAADDLNLPVGDDADPNLIEALAYLNTGACPVSSAPGGVQKISGETFADDSERRSTPQWVYLNAL